MSKEQAHRRMESLPLPQDNIPRHTFEEFTYIVAHDLGAPLRRMVNFTQLLEKKYRPALDEQALHYLDLIAQNGQRAQAHLAGLLQYSRLDATSLSREKVNCKQVIDHCLRQLGADIESREALIHVGPLPQITGDTERLELLFYCLISNALKFCNDRPDIDIRARYEHDSWIFSVRDCGIGIAAERHDEIFDLFCRLHGDSEYPGSGMGLALARRIAELHGGSIEVESHPGEGATFHVLLPDEAPSGG
jgi:light-regulated signal transduction histidine kinase (bacteriophytochrome)